MSVINTSTIIQAGVIGVGYLGKFHAEKYAGLGNANLVAVCDTQHERCQKIAQQYNTQAIIDYRNLVGRVSAVSIAVPTISHYEIGKFFLENNIHVLMEKPITTNVAQAEELIKIAAERDLVFQVGHLERFNSVLQEAQKFLDKPQYIESHRLAMFKPRGIDVNVMLDLMIHDIDLVQHLIGSPIHEIRANGAKVLSDCADIATVRIQFANACVANVVASRVSMKSERKMRIFQHNAYISLDWQNRLLTVLTKGEGEMFPGIPEVNKQEINIDQEDALEKEIRAFLHAISHHSTPIVTGEEGKRALAIAMEITQRINTQFELEATAA